MGTRGYRVVRFRKRYYRFYNQWDSYPEGLGKDLACGIPKDSQAYQKWLAQQRQEALGWHNALEQFLCRNDAGELDAGELVVDQEHPWGVATETLPDFKPALNDLYIEWVYTIDLDNEVFTIDNGAHVQLSRASDLAWIPAIAHAFDGDRILLPDSIDTEAIADIVVKLPDPSASVLETYTNLNVEMVKSKGFDGFSTSHRHGPLFRSRIFYMFREMYEPIFATTLLNWTSEDLIFRDIAYAVLCLACADFYPSIVPSSRLLQKGRIAFAALKKGDEGNERDEGKEEDEFISDLGLGSHVENVLPGCSPDSEMYWFGDVLIYLVVQLIDLPEILNAAVVSIVEYCQKERPNQRVDAVLMSIEHVVLMTVESGGRVQRTELLVLFDIPNHTSMNANGRYEEHQLEEMQKLKQKSLKRREMRKLKERKKWAIREGTPLDDDLKDVSLDSDQSDDEGIRNVEEQTSWPAAGLQPPRLKKAEAGFMALAFFLEASSRRHLPRTQEGVFPSEIYRTILLNIEDVETHRACMRVSTNFRDMCQDDILMTKNFRLQANEESKTYELGTPSFPSLRMQNLSTGRLSNVALKRAGQLMMNFGLPPSPPEPWYLVIGSEYNRRSFISDLPLTFNETK